MKRLIMAACVVGLLVALPLSHVARANEVEKYRICHVNKGNEVVTIEVLWFEIDVTFGREIIVDLEGKIDHLYISDHGDRKMVREGAGFFEQVIALVFKGKAIPLWEDLRDLLREKGVKLPNANCVLLAHGGDDNG
jgi:hypothetical protein